MKRLLLAMSLALLMVLSVAGPALAGEVKGPPGPGGATGGSTPVDGFWTGDGPASICAFSGLNDVIDDFETTQVQSYGRFMVMIMKAMNLSSAEAKAFLGEAPHEYCNPNHAPWGNPKKGGGEPPPDPV